MQIALSGRSLGNSHPLEEDIRVAAITGYPWLVLDHQKLEAFLAEPDFTIRDLTRLFLRTQPAAIDGLHLASSDPVFLPQLEKMCKLARRVGAPVVVVRMSEVDERLRLFAEVAQGWGVVLAVAATAESPFEQVRGLIEQVDHPALGLYMDVGMLWREGRMPRPTDAERTVLLAINDLDEAGEVVLPGDGIIPLEMLLMALYVGGYDGLAVLDMGTGLELSPVPAAWAQEAYERLSDILIPVGWEVTS